MYSKMGSNGTLVSRDLKNIGADLRSIGTVNWRGDTLVYYHFFVVHTLKLQLLSMNCDVNLIINLDRFMKFPALQNVSADAVSLVFKRPRFSAK